MRKQKAMDEQDAKPASSNVGETMTEGSKLNENVPTSTRRSNVIQPTDNRSNNLTDRHRSSVHDATLVQMTQQSVSNAQGSVPNAPGSVPNAPGSVSNAPGSVKVESFSQQHVTPAMSSNERPRATDRIPVLSQPAQPSSAQAPSIATQLPVSQSHRVGHQQESQLPPPRSKVADRAEPQMLVLADSAKSEMAASSEQQLRSQDRVRKINPASISPARSPERGTESHDRSPRSSRTSSERDYNGRQCASPGRNSPSRQGGELPILIEDCEQAATQNPGVEDSSKRLPRQRSPADKPRRLITKSQSMPRMDSLFVPGTEPRKRSPARTDNADVNSIIDMKDLEKMVRNSYRILSFINFIR